MNGTYVLSALAGLGHGERGLAFPYHSTGLRAMVSSCGFIYESSQHYDWHGLRRGNAEFVLLQLTLGGRGCLRYERSSYELAPARAMLLHFPHDNRYYLPHDSDGWEFLYVCMHGREVMRLAREVEHRAGPVLDMGPDSPAALRLSELVRMGLEGRIDTPFECSRLAYALTMALCDQFIPTRRGTDQPEPIKRALRVCAKAQAAGLSVQTMAAAAGYSRFHFSRVFAETMGVSPGEYLKQQRIDRAMTLLRTTTLSVKEIAAACGYYDATHFCRSFKQRVGVPPRTFRVSGMY